MARARLAAALASPHAGVAEALTHPGLDHMGGSGHPTFSAGSAVSSASSTTTVPAPKAPSVPSTDARGLDVSSYQGNVDWSAVSRAGGTFAYVKATEGTYYMDSAYFAQQYVGSYDAGLVRGAYHFAIPSNSGGAAQADYFVANGGGWSADGRTLPGTLDIEYNPYGAECYGLSTSQMVAWVASFDAEYKLLTGRFPTVYTTTDWWRACTGNASGFALEGLALAIYGSSIGTLPASWTTWDIWQYADSGTLPGDQDVFNGDVDQLHLFAIGASAVAGSVALYCAAGDQRSATDASVQAGVVVTSGSRTSTSYHSYTVSPSGALTTIPTGASSAAVPLVAVWQDSTDCAGDPASRNSWAVTPQGKVYVEAALSGPQTRNYGDASKLELAKPIVGMAPVSDAGGYWLVASDGGVFSYGDATFHGSMGAVRLAQPVVGMAATPDGRGYWLVASDGGVFAFGDAAFRGSMGGVRLNRPVEAILSTPDGKGYWMVASDGGVFCFGDAVFRGSAGAMNLPAPIAGMVANGAGYTLIGQDGRTYPFD